MSLICKRSGKVYDVSKGGDFLAGGRLSSLTGHDCSRALALQTADPALLNSRFDDLNFDEMNRLEVLLMLGIFFFTFSSAFSTQSTL
jgi:hypothetical protein